jgi:ABC-type sugar transport system permease subunit
MNRTSIGSETVARIMLATPFLLLMVVFTYLPVGIAGWQGFGPSTSPLNSASLGELLGRKDVIDSILRTVAFLCVKVPVNVALGLLLALALSAETPTARLARSLLLLPTLVSVVVLGVVVLFLFDREVGLVNLIIASLGGKRENWLLEPLLTQALLTGFSIWRDQGLIMFIFLAGLRSIPPQLYEAAAIDGASSLNVFFTITLPLLIRSTGFAIIFALYMGAQFIAPILQITKGGPQSSTTTLPFLVYEEAFEFFDYRAASALSLLFIVVVLGAAIVIGWLTRPKWTH